MSCDRQAAGRVLLPAAGWILLNLNLFFLFFLHRVGKYYTYIPSLFSGILLDDQNILAFIMRAAKRKKKGLFNSEHSSHKRYR